MTQAKAQTVAAALIGLGYALTVYLDGSGEWKVKAEGTAISVVAVSTFGTNQSITGTVTEVVFV